MIPPVMVPAILIAVSIPLLFLYFIRRLDIYGSERSKLFLLALAWGMLATVGAYVVNHSLWEYTNTLPQIVVTRLTAPITEELFKSLILIYLVRRTDFTYFVDGAVYGFAVGTGFAVVENVSYLYRVPESETLIVAVIRVFSAALLHGTASGIVGTTLGRFRFGRGISRTLSPVLGLGAAMALHITYNNTVTAEGLGALAVLLGIGIGLGGVALTAASVIAGLREERSWLHETLGLKLRVSEEEATIIQHLGDLDKLLQPVTKRFGKRKRDQVATFLHLEARLGLKREVEEKAIDPEAKAELHNQVVAMEEQLDSARRDVGVYVMAYVRSILPPTKWSIWVRLAQILATRQSPATSSVWLDVTARFSKRDGGREGDGLYAHLERKLDVQAETATIARSRVEELPEELRNCVHWVMREKEVTLRHVVQGLRHEDEAALSMLNHLTERGFLHRTEVDGEARYRPRVAAKDAQSKVDLWRAAHRKIQRPSA